MSDLTLNEVHKYYGDVHAVRGVSLDVAEGAFTVLVGPSGCGKSTLLRMIAGLEEIDSGDIAIGSQVVNRLRPRDRNIAMVFQNYALYPYLTVFDNIAFGLRAHRVAEPDVARRVRETAAMLGIADLLERHPRQLSGGQRQRVAIGRAVVRDAGLFLFDEPLSNLDAQLRDEMRAELKRLHQDIGKTMIYVTHDQIEAMTLADRIVLLNEGRIEQEGAPLDLFERPRTRFVAGFLGSPQMNFIEATATKNGACVAFRIDAGNTLSLEHAPAGIAEGQAVVLGIRPEHFSRRGNEPRKEVRKGFGLEGLQGLEGRVVSDGGRTGPTEKLATRQLARYRAAARDLILPAFMISDVDGWRLVHYEADILSRLPWDDIDLSALGNLKLDEGKGEDDLLRTNLTGEARVSEPEVAIGSYPENVETPDDADTANGGDPVDYFFAASHLLDLVPNPWRGHDLARRTFEALLEHHPAERVAANHVFVLEELRRTVEMERDRLSREVFRDLLESETMRFLVVAEDLDFNRLPAEIEVPKAKRANREDGSPYQRNLFDVSTEDDLNQFENKVASYLDQQARLFFWYRNRARKDYYIQGWTPRRIYADFIVTLRDDEPGEDDGFRQVFVVETKGVHLKTSEDTEYKRSVFDICGEHARKADWAEFVPAMRSKVMRFEVVDEDEWQARLNGMLYRGEREEIGQASASALRVPRFRGRFMGAVYVALGFNTPSVCGEQDFPAT